MNYFANPNNGIKLTSGVNCGCEGDSPACAANFCFVWDEEGGEGGTITLTDFSFLSDGDSIVSPGGVQIKIQDSDLPTPAEVNDSGDGTAPVVVDVSTLDMKSDSVRIDYTITTDNGCTSTAVLFFNPNTTTEGCSDPYHNIR